MTVIHNVVIDRSLPDKVIFAIGAVVALVVALMPVTFFRAISFGRFREADVSPTLLKVIQVIAAFVTVSSVVHLIVGVRW